MTCTNVIMKQLSIYWWTNKTLINYIDKLISLILMKFPNYFNRKTLGKTKYVGNWWSDIFFNVFGFQILFKIYNENESVYTFVLYCVKKAKQQKHAQFTLLIIQCDCCPLLWNFQKKE